MQHKPTSGPWRLLLGYSASLWPLTACGAQSQQQIYMCVIYVGRVIFKLSNLDILRIAFISVTSSAVKLMKT